MADTGKGIPPEIVGHIFDPFFTTKEHGRGTGLGLSMIHGTVAQHGGGIVVDTVPGRGTEVSVYLRLDSRTGEADGGDPGAGVAADEAADNRRYVILVAEDEAAVRRVLEKTLSSAGYRVVAVPDGKAAVAAFTERSGAFDLVLLDVVMPEMGGLEALERIRGVRPDVRALLLSGYGFEYLERRGKAGAGEEILSKPVDLPSLLARVAELTRRG